VNYTSIENDIVARLAPLVTAGYQVEAMPDREADNIGIGHKGRITVQVSMVKFGDHQSTPPAVVQEEDIYIDIIIRARALRASGGIYHLCELCRVLLLAYVPNNCRIPLSGVDFGPIAPEEYDKGVHMYSLRLKTQSMSVGFPDADVYPLITEVDYEGESVTLPPPTAAIFASAYSVESSGDQVMIAWITSGGDEVNVSGIGIVDAIGSATVTITEDTTYTVTVYQGDTEVSATLDVVIGATCADASVTVNTTPFTTAPSGGSVDVPVVNGGSNPVGSDQGGQWVIGDSSVFINGTQVGDVVAEDSLPIAVTLDGVQSGTWNAGLQTWQVVSPPPSQAWVRDPNWQAMPALDSSGERFDGLFLVFEDEFNMVTVTTNVGATLDPGDGSAPIAGTGGNIFHIYDYATMAGAVNVYQPIASLPPRNYKQAMVRVTGTITVLNFGATSLINGNGTNNFVDVQASLPNRTGNSFRYSNEIGMGRNMGICERARVFNWNGAYATAGSVFGGMTSMRVVQIPTAAGSLSAAFSTNSMLDLGDLTTTTTSMIDMCRPTVSGYHSIRSAGHIVANSVTGTGLTTMFFGNADLQYVLSLTGTLATSLSSYATSARQLRYHGLITCPAVTNISNIFNGCVLLKEVRFSDCAAVNTAVTPFLNMPSLEILEVPNLDRGVSVAGSAMGNAGALIWANSLGTASGSQTNTVTGTPFGALLTALNPTALAIEAIMTGKGFTVAN
jgi:hypothetical protein